MTRIDLEILFNVKPQGGVYKTVCAIANVPSSPGITEIEYVYTSGESISADSVSVYTAKLPHIVSYRANGWLHCQTQYYGPFANHDDAYEFLCTLPAVGLYDDQLHEGQHGHKFTQALFSPVA